MSRCKSLVAANRMAGRKRVRSPVEVKRLLDGVASGLKDQFWARRWGGCTFAAGSSEPSIEVRSGSKPAVSTDASHFRSSPISGPSAFGGPAWSGLSAADCAGGVVTTTRAPFVANVDKVAQQPRHKPAQKNAMEPVK
jgi:hypothetical protein